MCRAREATSVAITRRCRVVKIAHHLQALVLRTHSTDEACAKKTRSAVSVRSSNSATRLVSRRQWCGRASMRRVAPSTAEFFHRSTGKYQNCVTRSTVNLSWSMRISSGLLVLDGSSITRATRWPKNIMVRRSGRGGMRAEVEAGVRDIKAKSNITIGSSMTATWILAQIKHMLLEIVDDAGPGCHIRTSTPSSRMRRCFS